VETVINDPGDLGCKRSLEHLEELSAKARACNACVRHNSGCLEDLAVSERRSACRHPLAGAELPRDTNSATLAE